MSAPRRARDEPRVSAWVVGLMLVALLALLSYLAFTKKLPFTGEGYTLSATFENAATLRTDSPVRIAGVNVGKVLEVEGEGDMSKVTFSVDEDGLPIHEDAEIDIRPRLFLEGNFFLDVKPGSPSAPELADGGDIPTTQTSTAVQLDEVLTALQSDSRQNLQELLKGLGTALTYEPTAADDRGHDPDVAGENGARAINDAFRTGGRAGRGTAVVSDALRGRSGHDLSKMIEHSGTVFSELASRDDDLKGLITNFNVTTGALAAEQVNLSASLRELAPTLEQAEPTLRHLSGALPPLRAFALELEPSLRELPGTIRAAGPWLVQVRKLLRDSELGGLSHQLAEIGPTLGRTTDESIGIFRELNLLGQCTTDVLEPTGETVITGDPGSAADDAVNSNGQPNFNELLSALASQAGSLASFDGNGIYLRLQPGGGPVLAASVNPEGGFRNNFNFSQVIEEPLGTQPRVPVNGMPPFRTDVACHTNAAPNLNGPAAAVGPASPTQALP